MAKNGLQLIRQLPKGNFQLTLIALINRCCGSAFAMLTLFYQNKLHFSYFRTSMLLFTYGVGAILAGLIGGYLSDRYGALRTMKYTLILSAMTLFCYPWAQNFLLQIILTFLLAMVVECFRPANMSAVARFSEPSQRKLAYSFNRLGTNIGMSFGPLLALFIASYNFNMVFVFNGFASLIAGLLVLYYFNEDNLKQMGEGQKCQFNFLEELHKIFTALKDRRLMLTVLSQVLIIFVFFQHETTLPLFAVQQLDLKLTQIGLIFTINTLLIIFFELPLNMWMVHLSHKTCVIIGNLFMGSGFVMLMIVHNSLEFYLTVVLWTFGEMILIPTFSTQVSEIASNSNRGLYLGVFTSGFSFALAVGPFIGLLIVSQMGFNYLWSICGILAMFSLWIFTKL